MRKEAWDSVGLSGHERVEPQQSCSCHVRFTLQRARQAHPAGAGTSWPKTPAGPTGSPSAYLISGYDAFDSVKGSSFSCSAQQPQGLGSREKSVWSPAQPHSLEHALALPYLLPAHPSFLPALLTSGSAPNAWKAIVIHNLLN